MERRLLLLILVWLELAAAVDAKFVRGTFCGVYVGDGGLYDNDFSALLRRKAALHLDELKMLYFINPESDRNLDTRPLADIASSTIFKAHSGWPVHQRQRRRPGRG